MNEKGGAHTCHVQAGRATAGSLNTLDAVRPDGKEQYQSGDKPWIVAAEDHTTRNVKRSVDDYELRRDQSEAIIESGRQPQRQGDHSPDSRDVDDEYIGH
jgi:hypothetical protein